LPLKDFTPYPLTLLIGLIVYAWLETHATLPSQHGGADPDCLCLAAGYRLPIAGGPGINTE